MTNSIEVKNKKIVELLKSIPGSTRVRVVSHYDADGITAAAIICKALYRAGYDFHASLMRNPFDKGLERISKEDNELVIYSDMGSGQIETIEKMKNQSIIIDHHQPIKKKTGKNVLQLNANLCGMNGNYEACGSSLAYGVAKAINPENIDLSPLALAGITGDKQYIGGIQGFNQVVAEEALENGFVKSFTGLKLSGKNLFEALYYSVEPFYPGISGDKQGIEDLFKRLKIDKDVSFNDLSDSLKKKLRSCLLFILIKNGVEKNILDTVIRKRFYWDTWGYELEAFADLLDSCGKGGNRGLGLAICLGDKKSFEQAVKLEKKFKQDLLKELTRLYKEGAQEEKYFRYFYSKNSSMGGVIGGIASNFIFDKSKPLISIVRKNDEIHVSCRGNQYLVNNGLDLGSAMKKAAKELSGHGGGHSIAAGATIDREKEKKFLEITKDVISKQLKNV